MSHLQEIPYEQSEGRLREIYNEELKSLGYIKNTNRVMSSRPEAIDAWNALVKAIRANMRLRRYELVTLAASQAQGCKY